MSRHQSRRGEVLQPIGEILLQIRCIWRSGQQSTQFVIIAGRPARGGRPIPAALSFPTCESDSILVRCPAGRPEMSYSAPVADMRFVLEEVAELDQLATLPGYEAASPDLTEAILEEAATLAGNELAPLNQPADRAGDAFANG